MAWPQRAQAGHGDAPQVADCIDHLIPLLHGLAADPGNGVAPGAGRFLCGRLLGHLLCGDLFEERELRRRLAGKLESPTRALQRLQELVTELYLAEGKKKRDKPAFEKCILST